MYSIPYLGKAPVLKSGSRAAVNATLVGDVTVERGASVWYGAVLRGDSNSIHVGERSNIQDNVVIHTEEDCPTVIGARTAVGHSCVIHGCTVGANCLIGMGSVLMNGCVIGERCIVGAGALVTQHTVIPAGSLVVGSPAKVKRPLTEAELEMLEHNYEEYVALSAQLAEMP